MKARDFAGALVVALVLGHCAGASALEDPPEPRRAAIHRRAEAAAAGRLGETEWKRKLRAKLQRKVSFEFVDTPLSQAISFLQTLTRANIVIDRDEGGGLVGGDTPINLKVRDMTMGLALSWILKLAELEYDLRDGAIFIAKPGKLARKVVLRIYDVRDLLGAVEDFPGPELGPTGRLGGGGGDDADAGRVLAKARAGGYHAGSLAEMIQTRIRPDAWAQELGASLEERGGRLVVVQTPEVHALVERLLRTLRAARKLQVRVEVRFVAMSEKLIDSLRAGEKPGAATVFLRRPQIEMLEKALAAGDEGAAEFVEAAHLGCCSSQRTHTISGRAFERRGAGGKVDGVYFRGTVLDVRPKVSFDRKYVTMELRLTRVAGDGLNEPPEYFKARTTVTCLQTDTVMITGATVQGGRRLVALVRPSALGLEPDGPAARKRAGEARRGPAPQRPAARVRVRGARIVRPAAPRPARNPDGAAAAEEVF